MENKKITQQLGELFQLIRQYETLSLNKEKRDYLTPSEHHLIECIGLEGNKTSKEIGERLNITKGAVSQQVKKLIENEVILKEISEDDKRISYLSLTEKGINFYLEHQTIKIDFDRVLEKKLTEVERLGFFKGMDQLTTYLNQTIKAEKTNEK